MSESMKRRELEAGLYLAGNDPMAGRSSPIASKIGLSEETAKIGTFGTKGRLAGEPKRQRDSEDGIETIEIKGNGVGGLKVRLLGGAIASSGDEPSTAEYQAALQATYTSNSVTPQRGDLITLRVSGGTRLIARFWILEDDQAATNATVAFTYGDPPVTYYALNLSYSPIEQIIDAIQDYLAGPNGGQDPDGRDIEPATNAPFAIAVNGNYSTDANGFLVASNSVNISVNAGTAQFIDDQPAATVAEYGPAAFNFSATDGTRTLAAVLLARMPLTGAQGTIASISASIGVTDVTSGTYPPAVSDTDFVTFPGEATRRYLIGTIILKRNGNRRWVGITQTFSGDVKLAGSTGNSASVDGVNLAAGLREFTICINGKPYKTHLLTGPLTAVT